MRDGRQFVREYLSWRNETPGRRKLAKVRVGETETLPDESIEDAEALEELKTLSVLQRANQVSQSLYDVTARNLLELIMDKLEPMS